MTINPFDPVLARGHTRRIRDLVLVGIDENSVMCIACDSSGGFGSKPQDFRHADGFDVGYAVAKIPLMEVLSAGAEPVVLIDNLCVEMTPSGLPILEGIRAACAASGFDIEISGSDETNIPTVQTGLGATVLAMLDRSRSRLLSSEDGDVLVIVGSPLGGDADLATFREGDENVAGIATIIELLRRHGVHEILPVGSRGIAFEAGELASGVGLSAVLRADSGVDLQRSGGTSTVVVCTVAASALAGLLESVPGSQVVGHLTQ